MKKLSMDATTRMTEMLNLSDKLFKTPIKIASMSSYKHALNEELKHLSKEIESFRKEIQA